jgi:signal transduction histidine kinase
MTMAGVLIAWAVGQLILALFFGLVHIIGRREREYLVFGVFCATLSITVAGLALYHASPDYQALGPQIMVLGAFGTLATNLHFVLRYSGARAPRWLVPALYVFLALLVTGDLTGIVRILDGTVERSTWLDAGEPGLRPSPAGYALIAWGVIELLAVPVLLIRAVRRLKNEALGAVLGALVMASAGLHDTALALGLETQSTYLFPHLGLLYAFGVAATVLVRYRRTADELEQTVASLRQRTAELRHSHQELEVMQDELVKKQQLAAVGELAAAIAHEVRNPLAVIVNAIAGLRRARLSEEDRHTLLGIVDEETARLNRLVSDLLRFARPVSLKRAAVSLVELAYRSQAAAPSHCAVEAIIPDDPDLQTVWVDPGLFRVVFDNIVDNAHQAMPEGGTVRIVASRAELAGKPAVRIQIRDTGRGMDPEVAQRAVDPFFTTRPSGTGLGLPIVTRIIEAHGGQLSIETEQGVGTSVTLLIPMEKPAEHVEPSLLRGSA